MSQENIRRIELDIKLAKKNIHKADSLENLYTSPAFKEIIVEGYLKEEPIRLALLRADPSMQEKKHIKRIDAAYAAIGYLNQYFATINAIGNMSQRALQDDENTRNEIIQEGD